MRYCIDIDGTICTPGTCKSCQYEGSTPKKDRIEYVNKLYDEGHYIIYFTARAMGRNSDKSIDDAKKAAEASKNDIEELCQNAIAEVETAQEISNEEREALVNWPEGDVA